jgi:hypothetical protein
MNCRIVYKNMQIILTSEGILVTLMIIKVQIFFYEYPRYCHSQKIPKISLLLNIIFQNPSEILVLNAYYVRDFEKTCQEVMGLFWDF